MSLIIMTKKAQNKSDSKIATTKPLLPSPRKAGVARAGKMAGGTHARDVEESKDEGIQTRAKSLELRKKVVSPATIKKAVRPNLCR